MAKVGVIGRESLELSLAKVESVLVSQSILGRIFGYGDVVIVGTGGTKQSIPFIVKPLDFRKALQELQSA